MAKNTTRTDFWNDVVVKDDYKTYDTLCNSIKNHFAPDDDNLAYEIENEFNKRMKEMITYFEEKYGH